MSVLYLVCRLPYGRHSYKAAKLMREGMLLGSLLTNCESWINLTETDLTKLEQPDLMLQKKLLSISGNPCKAFMSLELGIIPVRFVIMGRRLNFLHYILNEPINSMISEVFKALKEESRKGDFYQLVQKDLQDLDIEMSENYIMNYKKCQWKLFVKDQVKNAAFMFLVNENSSRKKTKDIIFSELKMSDYLFQNRNKKLSEIIFSVRAKTFDIKIWQPWRYQDDLCVKCQLEEENMDHFINCTHYENKHKGISWKNILANNVEDQYDIAQFIFTRQVERERMLDVLQGGQPMDPGSGAPGDLSTVEQCSSNISE